MTGLVVFACVMLFLVLLLSIKARIILEYRDEVTLTVRIMGLFSLRILPKQEKKPKGPHSMSRRKAQRIKRKLEKKAAKKAAKKRKKQLEKEAKKAEKEQEKREGKPKKSLTVPDVLDLIHLVAAVLKTLVGTFFKHLRVRVARLRITVATGDAATTAIGYGAITQALEVLYPYLEQIPTFRFPELSDIDVGIDYLKDSPEVDLRMEFTLRLWHVFAVLFRTIGTALWRGIRFLFGYMKRQDDRGGHRPPKQTSQRTNAKTRKQ